MHPCRKRVGVCVYPQRRELLPVCFDAAGECCARLQMFARVPLLLCYHFLFPHSPRTTTGGLRAPGLDSVHPCSGRLCSPGVSVASEADDFHVCRKRRRDGRLRRCSLTLQHFCVFEKEAPWKSTGADDDDDDDDVSSSSSIRATVRGF